MRKIKKINGYLVVRFNDRERRDYFAEGIGEYGVIDAEEYSGHIDCDWCMFEYFCLATLEEAVEVARGLESELDITPEPPTYTVVIESDGPLVEEEVAPQLMIAGWENQLRTQVKSRHYPDVNPITAQHALYGYKVAMKDLGLIEEDECFVLPGVFDSEDEDIDSEPPTTSEIPRISGGSLQQNALLEYLYQRLDAENHNNYCYSGNMLMTHPKEGYEQEFEDAKIRVSIVEHLIALVMAAKEPPENQAAQCEGCMVRENQEDILGLLEALQEVREFGDPDNSEDPKGFIHEIILDDWNKVLTFSNSSGTPICDVILQRPDGLSAFRKVKSIHHNRELHNQVSYSDQDKM